MKVKSIIIVITLLVFSGGAFADPADITVKADKEKITIGDRIRYEIDAEYDNGVKVSLPDAAVKLGKFELKGYKKEEPVKLKNKRWLSRAVYILTIFETGEFFIPSVNVKYLDAKGGKREIKTKEIKIEVQSVASAAEDKDDIRPLKEPVGIKGRFSIFPFLAFVAFLLAIAAAFVYFRKKNRIHEKPLEAPRPPEEIAIEELRRLQEENLIEKGKIKEYYIRISDIIRRFLEARYRIVALDKTTWELYRELRARKADRAHISKINDFLEECDFVKFAKYVPEKKETEDIYIKAEEIVNTSPTS